MININSKYKNDNLCNLIGIAQINSTAGNLESNTNKIIEYIKTAEMLKLGALAFPLDALVGFSMTDFFNRYPFILEETNKYLLNIAKQTNNTSVLLPFINTNNQKAYAILKKGNIHKIINNIDYINSNELIDTMKFYIKPISEPSRAGSQYKLEEDLKNSALQLKSSIVQINRVGSVDGWSYSGESCVVNNTGVITNKASDFKEELFIVNPFETTNVDNLFKPTELPKDFNLDYDWDLERIYKSTIQTIKDYFNNCNLKRAVIGLSGGLDSTVCAVLLTDALGKDNVFGISMPSNLTTTESKSDAKILAENLGLHFIEAPIEIMQDSIKISLESVFDNVQNEWNCRYTDSYTNDNIQARARAIYLWGVANEFESCIPIATSDKSELYMGYATINGDMSGGFAPIADITKTKLFALAKWLNKNRNPYNAIPESIIEKRPGAELAINPKTGKLLFAEEALMPYEFLDEIIWRIENLNQSYKELLKNKFLYEKKFDITQEQKKEWLIKFFRRMSSALYKGFILPPATIVDSNSIIKNTYFQPITSCKINYLNT